MYYTFMKTIATLEKKLLELSLETYDSMVKKLAWENDNI